ncbi:unnamed protein product [Porites evermanni]|uniref:Anoctamin n=1 Tax=Porites evermanni TaxID=104178 RepID=A0ABN8M7D0_9CNID|nr:unnamed protein product [Porites evermanni]
MFLFQFVNTYSSIFYIAFFKLNLVIGTPGNYRRIGGKDGNRLDGCGVGGCLLDLCIQLVIIMVGQQIIGNITEIAIPGLMKWWKMRQAAKESSDIPQWEQDYKLSPLPEHYMFWEYLEVVLQFGFVTMFVAAFPLAPLFALLNCAIELRVDAVNFVCQFRRPIADRAQDIGAWYRIMEGIANLSVLVNAFVLAFTSEFIPRLVYRNSYSADGTLAGYVNNSLSYFNVSDWDTLNLTGEPDDKYAYQELNYTMDFCRYPGYHEPHAPYAVTKEYWHVIAARLAFVFVFQYVVYACTKFVAWLVPDRPKLLELKIKREEFLAKESLQQRGVEDIDDGDLAVVAYMASPDTKTVRIDVDDPPVYTGDEESDRLFVEEHRTNAKRKIDYVLVYETCQEEEDKIPTFKTRARNHENMRKRFETSLKEAGLELDSPDPQETSRDLVSHDLLENLDKIKPMSKDAKSRRPVDVRRSKSSLLKFRNVDRRPPLQRGSRCFDTVFWRPSQYFSIALKRPLIKRHFVLIHAPWSVLAKHAEEMHLKVPFKENDVEIKKSWLETKLKDKRNPLVIQDPTFEAREDFFTANFRQDRFEKFVKNDHIEEFFDNIDRVYIVQRICKSAYFGASDDKTEEVDVGLENLILSGAYVAAYPLHDGLDVLERDKTPKNDRQCLKRDCARPGRLCKYQPYDAINKYFGSEIAMYFAWVGFYTGMLAPLAIIGLIVFLYGIGSAGDHIPVKDVCDENNKGKWYMCPLCDKKCSYWDLASTTCVYAYVTHFFDNDWTVGLAVIASIWGTLFLEL